MSGPFWTIQSYSLIVSTTVTLITVAKLCSMYTLELHGDILQPGGQLETPGFFGAAAGFGPSVVWNIFQKEFGS